MNDPAPLLEAVANAAAEMTETALSLSQVATGLTVTASFMVEAAEAFTEVYVPRREVLVWISMRELGAWPGVGTAAPITDDELRGWKAKGVDGFIASFGWLRGLGGNQEFALDSYIRSEAYYDMHEMIKYTNLIERCHAAGLKFYLGASLCSTTAVAPGAAWHDDTAWVWVCRYWARTAAAARMIGADGLSIDLEPYAPTPAHWRWSYSGNPNTQTVTRAKVIQRGEELAEAITDAFPDVPLSIWAVRSPGGWAEYKRNMTPPAYASEVQLEFIDGLQSNEGIARIDLVDEWFYKGTQGGTWTEALAWDQNNLQNKKVAWDWDERIRYFPGIWINTDGNTATTTVASATTQLQAYTASQPKGPVYMFHYGKLRTFDYTPYASDLLAASET